MTTSAPIAKMTYAEYLAFEQKSETKHEFLNGEVFAMAGGTIEHGALAASLARVIGNALRARPCRPLSSDVRVRVKATDLATYPDLTIVCGKVETDRDDPDGVLDPSLIIEVLSDSTEAYDRGAKAAHYRRIPSLREYVLVSQDAPLIEVHRRNERGNWELVSEARKGERAELASCGDAFTIEVDEVYRNPLTS
ncbi:MAG TPA: Uma2 family endonuclease [Polyangiaceae bacterium]|jgi:Uma2 family endonuclease